ncbi:uncharacterized protein FIBRA_04832 [Fibroporia radiculosa]|uniref:Uncharacterized protein n=1 Tax=Fibroporia radiculosa TaxID=599839 RepID=J4GPW3_9APHY|nr:uncharacterized protein FIBRA_04832 [Fibroporia radiculosa]CCM02725.1 predicted protein [Fibroporia radiculosa]
MDVPGDESVGRGGAEKDAQGVGWREHEDMVGRGDVYLCHEALLGRTGLAIASERHRSELTSSGIGTLRRHHVALAPAHSPETDAACLHLFLEIELSGSQFKKAAENWADG